MRTTLIINDATDSTLPSHPIKKRNSGRKECIPCLNLGVPQLLCWYVGIGRSTIAMYCTVRIVHTYIHNIHTIHTYHSVVSMRRVPYVWQNIHSVRGMY